MAAATERQYLTPFRHRDFSVFWIGSFLSSMGTQFTTVAMAWQIYELTNSPIQIGLLGLARALPQIVLLLVGGLLADARDRRKLMMCTQTGLFCVSAKLALLSYFGLASSAMQNTGPVTNLAVMSNVAPSYAPPGQSLIQATVVGNPGMSDSDLESQSRGELSRWFGPEVDGWRLLRLYRIVKALPDQKPPTPDPLSQEVKVKPWLFVCGEYQSLSSIQWAMVSGRRAGEAVVQELQP